MISFEKLWERLCSLQNHVFHTLRGMPFTYTITGSVMRIDRKANPITRSTVELAYRAAVDAHGEVPGPKALRCFGASYLYAVFVYSGLIEVPDEAIATPPSVDNKPIEERLEDKTMPRPKGSRNKPALTIDEQITQAAAHVEELKEALDAAQSELKALETLRDEEQVKELMNAIADSGKSVSDVIELIRRTEGEA